MNATGSENHPCSSLQICIYLQLYRHFNILFTITIFIIFLSISLAAAIGIKLIQ